MAASGATEPFRSRHANVRYSRNQRPFERQQLEVTLAPVADLDTITVHATEALLQTSPARDDFVGPTSSALL
jgi:hypothetical protein